MKIGSIITIVILFLITIPVNAVEITDGLSEHIYSNVSQGIDVLVMNGLYELNRTVIIPNNYTFTCINATLNASGTFNEYQEDLISFLGVHNSSITGCELEGHRLNLNGIRINASNNSDNNKIIKNTIRNFSSYGGIVSGGRNTIIEDNVLIKNGNVSKSSGNIFVTSQKSENVTVKNNTNIDSYGQGIMVDDKISNVSFIRNHVTGSLENGMSLACQGRLPNCRNITISGNIIYNNIGAGIYTNVVMYEIISNNAVYNNGYFGVLLSESNNGILRNNLIHDNNQNYDEVRIGGTSLNMLLIGNYISGNSAVREMEGAVNGAVIHNDINGTITMTGNNSIDYDNDAVSSFWSRISND